MALVWFAASYEGPWPVRVVPSSQGVVSDVIHGADGIASRRPEVGMSIAVIARDEVAHGASGARDSDGKSLVDQHTVFEIGSVTKTFTALLLALTVAKGTSRPDDLLDAHLPPGFVLPERLVGTVRLTDLASHQSGLPNLSSDHHIQDLIEADPVQPFASVTSTYLARVLNGTERLEGHGTYQYNNFAFALLGEVLAGIEGVDYPTALHQSVLVPCALSSTSLDEAPGRYAAGTHDSTGAPAAAIRTASLAPAGGLRSDTVDMVSYLRLQMDPPDALFAEAVELTQQPHLTDGDRVVCLGWEGPPASGGSWLEKSGDTFGNSALLRFDRERRLGVVVLVDHQDPSLVEAVTEQLWRRLGES